jgi:hypothetical protein
MKYGLCGKTLVIVLLMSFWRIPLYAEPPTMPPKSSDGSGTRRYSESEVDCLAKLDLLIEDLTAAAEEAIEKAAAEAARAAMLASLDREIAAFAEAQRLQTENGDLRKSRAKAMVVTGMICFFGGLAIGAGGIAILQGVR